MNSKMVRRGGSPIELRTGRKLRVACSLTLAAFLCVAAGTSAGAKNGAVEFAKYFNPIQKKGYLNESQDRIIKKRSFKGDALPDADLVLNKEIGIFALLKPEDASNDSLIEEMLSRPDVNGLSITLPWQQLEPSEDQFNWQTVDHLLELASKHDKTLILRVSTCGVDSPSTNSDTPKWVFDAGVKSLPYTGADGNTHQMPIFWDSNYLANWRNFVKEMGKRYDKNPNIHSIGITGGGILGGTAVIPDLAKPATGSGSSKGSAAGQPSAKDLEATLKKEHGMNQRQIVEHWKYVADIFPKSFENARLNFDIDPPVPGRAGQDALDEISDYLIYRYGQRVYLTRQNVKNEKHGFDQYRVLLKFRPDTLTGYQLSPDLNAAALQKLAKFALDDGISFAEVPTQLLQSKDDAVKEPIRAITSRIGYLILAQKAAIAPEVPSGEPLKASFTFVNLGAATPMKPNRNFDKDVASSYRVLVELKDANGKSVLLSIHTPPTPTNKWTAGTPVTYEEDLKMPKLATGEYQAFLWIIDADSKRKLQLLDAVSHEKPTPSQSVPLGKLKVVGEGQALGSSGPAPQ